MTSIDRHYKAAGCRARDADAFLPYRHEKYSYFSKRLYLEGHFGFILSIKLHYNYNCGSEGEGRIQQFNNFDSVEMNATAPIRLFWSIFRE